MFGIGHWEIIIVASVALLLFGPVMLPRLARSMGASLFEFKRSVKEIQDAADDGKPGT